MNALGEGNDKPQGADALLKAAGIEDVALYPANPGMRYTGMIVAADAQTVVQQVAAHTYIAHKASALSPSPQPGQRVSIHQNTVTPPPIARTTASSGNVHSKGKAMAIDSAYDDDVSDVLEAMTDLFEANTPTDSYFVQQAIQGGDRSDILQALSEINQSESQFKDGVAALNAEPEETQGLVQRFEQEKPMQRAALEQRLQQEVAAETGMAVFEARDGLN